MDAKLLSSEEYEVETLRRALAGDPDAGLEALRLCRAALDAGHISATLRQYLAERLWSLEQALEQVNAMKSAGKSSGSIRSARDAALSEALLLNRSAVGRPSDPFPEWQVKYAAFGTILLKAGWRPEKVKAEMDASRRILEGPNAGLDRRTAERILSAYRPMLNLDREVLENLAGPLREKLPTFQPQEKDT